jgi:hypothetical protein
MCVITSCGLVGDTNVLKEYTTFFYCPEDGVILFYHVNIHNVLHISRSEVLTFF